MLVRGLGRTGFPFEAENRALGIIPDAADESESVVTLDNPLG